MKFLALIVALIIMSSSSCRRIQGHSYIPLKNNTNKEVLVVIGSNIDTIQCDATVDKIKFSYNSIIPPNSIKEDLLIVYNEDWESRLSYSKWYVYFFNKDTFYNFPCDTFKKYQWYKKQELTLDYLNQNNWTITYP